MISDTLSLHLNFWNTTTLNVSQKPSLKGNKQSGISEQIPQFYQPGNALSTASSGNILSVQSLGWTAEETLETYARLRHFAEDWDAPGMEGYDQL
ncbi:hypothetical protein [Treponema sp. J25]|uniref:hypothetical protein n=1 Tax=Treponema sp. J25 TaxID=2094121 RepID=UPI001043D16C|nr:hypothetical protein [Treponema sp. J25]TCW61246.1 hypothetical protein C5O22_07115 [Treponema sp. J25]